MSNYKANKLRPKLAKYLGSMVDKTEYEALEVLAKVVEDPNNHDKAQAVADQALKLAWDERNSEIPFKRDMVKAVYQVVGNSKQQAESGPQPKPAMAKKSPESLRSLYATAFKKDIEKIPVSALKILDEAATKLHNQQIQAVVTEALRLARALRKSKIPTQADIREAISRVVDGNDPMQEKELPRTLK